MSRDVRSFDFVRRHGAPLFGHSVTPNPGGWFDVVSGRSGESYRVKPLGGGGMAAECECVGARRSPAPCSHVRAVWQYAEAVMAIVAEEGK